MCVCVHVIEKIPLSSLTDTQDVGITASLPATKKRYHPCGNWMSHLSPMPCDFNLWESFIEVYNGQGSVEQTNHLDTLVNTSFEVETVPLNFP